MPPSQFDCAGSNAEPRRYPYIFNAKHQPQENLDRQAEHQDKEQLSRYHLQQGHTLKDLPAKTYPEFALLL